MDEPRQADAVDGDGDGSQGSSAPHPEPPYARSEGGIGSVQLAEDDASPSPSLVPAVPLSSLPTPSLTMSAGADPWAEPSAYAPHAAEMRKPGRANPWATGSPAPELDGATMEGTISTTEETATDDVSMKKAMLTKKLQDSRLSDDVALPFSDAKHYLIPHERQGYDLPTFGKPATRYWSFKPGFLNLNNGAFGACPRPVMDAFRRLEEQQEETPDYFRYKTMGKMLAENRERVSGLLNCSADEIAFLLNATTATNAILRDMVFDKDDAVLTLSSTYDAVQRTIDYVSEGEGMRGIVVKNIVVDLVYPMTHDAILAAVRQAIESAQKAGKRIRLGFIDTVASKPGVRLPWEALTALLREKKVLSVIDGAHGIGHVPIDLRASDPDFFVSNCHKWLYTHRSCAVFYVAPRNRGLQRSSLPTSHNFRLGATAEDNTWLTQWSSSGTEDMAPRLSIGAALDFRESLGGEARIINYNHDLAVRGGAEAARILGTDVMDVTDHSLTACMANVRLPIVRARIASEDGTAWMAQAETWFFDTLFDEFKTCLPVYMHDGKVWARFSAQIWLGVDDFAFGARALLELCRRINEGEVNLASGSWSSISE